jgi:hypothetical protein
MIHRATLIRSLTVECVEERCLLSTAGPELGSSGVVDALARSTPALLTVTVSDAMHGTDAAGLAGPALQALNKHRLHSSSFALQTVSSPFSAPFTGRVQVDNVGLVNGRTYPMVSALGVLNATGQNIPAGSFTVKLPGSSFTRAFPATTWGNGQVLAFFVPVLATGFQFKLGGTTTTVNANAYPNVQYVPGAFTATLGNLINGSAFGGRYALVS